MGFPTRPLTRSASEGTSSLWEMPGEGLTPVLIFPYRPNHHVRPQTLFHLPDSHLFPSFCTPSQSLRIAATPCAQATSCLSPPGITRNIPVSIIPTHSGGYMCKLITFLSTLSAHSATTIAAHFIPLRPTVKDRTSLPSRAAPPLLVLLYTHCLAQASPARKNGEVFAGLGRHSSTPNRHFFAGRGLTLSENEKSKNSSARSFRERNTF